MSKNNVIDCELWNPVQLTNERILFVSQTDAAEVGDYLAERYEHKHQPRMFERPVYTASAFIAEFDERMRREAIEGLNLNVRIALGLNKPQPKKAKK